jgi:hypothetical protein
MAAGAVNKLRELRARFVSLVDAPAHPLAEVVISKRADPEGEPVVKGSPDVGDVHVDVTQTVDKPKRRKKGTVVPPDGAEVVDVGKSGDDDVDHDAAIVDAALDLVLEEVEKDGRVFAQHRMDRLQHAHSMIGQLLAEGKGAPAQPGHGMPNDAEDAADGGADDAAEGDAAGATDTENAQGRKAAQGVEKAKGSGVSMADVRACADPAHKDMNAFDHLAAHMKEKAKVAKADRPMKTEAGESYPAEAYAYVPDPESPSTWKLRLWESPAKKVTASQVGAAAAAFSPGGFRGNRVQIPAGDVATVKAKVRSAWKSANPGKADSEMPASIAKGVMLRIGKGVTVTVADRHAGRTLRIPVRPGGGVATLQIGGRAGVQHERGGDGG